MVPRTGLDVKRFIISVWGHLTDLVNGCFMLASNARLHVDRSKQGFCVERARAFLSRSTNRLDSGVKNHPGVLDGVSEAFSLLPKIV